MTTGAIVTLEGVLRLPSLVMNVTTGGMVKGEVDLAKLDVSQNTGSIVKLTGKSVQLNVNGDTGSQFTGDNLVAGTCQAKVSTGAQIRIRAEKELDVKASTGGQVRYSGNPVIRAINVSSGGQVARQGSGR